MSLSRFSLTTPIAGNAHVTSYSKASLAEQWDCNPATIARLIEVGELEAFKLGRVVRITKASVCRYMARRAMNDTAFAESDDGMENAR